MKILVVTETRGAVACIRLLSPLTQLEQEGKVQFEVVTLEKPQTFDLTRLDSQDIIVFQRTDVPETLDILRYAQMKGKRTVYDIDDDLFSVPPGHPLHEYFLRPKIRQGIIEFLEQVDHVTVSTGSLKDRLSDHNQNITVLPNQLDDGIFIEPLPKRDEGGKCRIGYAGGWTHEDDFRQVLPALKRIQNEYGDQVELVFFWYIPEEFRGDPRIEYLGGTEDLHEFARRLNQARLDIGLAPLAHNSFNEAKSDEKFLEYASQKIAGVYSASTPYDESVIDGQTGLKVESDDPDAWYEKIKYLIDHPSERQRIQEESYNHVQRKRNVAHTAEKLMEVYQGLLSEPVRDRTQTAQPVVSIIIPVKDRYELTRQCLHAVRETTQGLNYEIIVIDNGSTDGTSELVDLQDSNFRYLYNEDGATFAQSNNQGGIIARGEYLLFLNNDTIPQEGWLRALLDAHQRYPDTGVVGAKLLYPESDTIQHAGVQIRDYPHPVFPYHTHHEFPAYAPAVNTEESVPAVTAACLLVKRTLFHSMKGFDEAFVNGYEDVDLCFRVLEKGLRNLYAPASEVYHYKSQTPGRFDHVKQNVARLQEEWGGKIRPLLTGAGHTLDHYDVSVVILTYNALDYTKRCVDSLLEHTNYPHEIIFVDNGSTDGTKDYLRGVVASNPNYQLIDNKTNRGFAAGNNQGVRAARGTYVLLLNNDVLVGDGWLESMVSALERDERIGMVGPITNYISGRQRLTDIPYQRDDEFYGFATTVRTANRGKVTPRRRIAGFAILTRKALFDELGGLDESFGSGNYEDDDFCLRAREKGYAIMVDESTYIHHFGSRSFTENQIDYGASLKKNEQLFRTKWPDIDLDWLLEKDEPLSLVLERKAKEAIDLINRGDLEGGERLCQEVLGEDPTLAEAVHGLGLIAHLNGHPREARIHYQRTVSLNKDWSPVHQSLALLDMTEGDLKSAQVRLAKILQKNPRDLDARRLLGQSFLEAEQFEEGISLLLGILQDDPNDWQTHFILASLYAEVDRREDMERHLEAVIAANPDHVQAREMLEKSREEN
jgi:GT2 family glycosyltransferase/glycosyltransferase involved in cell wall biosynthesis/Flp pilus assembly protein TadD